MNIKKIRFGVPAACELIATIILIPVVIKMAIDAYHDISYKSNFQTALEYYAVEDFPHSLQCLQKALKAHPERPEPLTLMALIQLRFKSFSDAQRYYRKLAGSKRSIPLEAALGKIVCQMHAWDKDNSEDIGMLETELKKLEDSFPRSPEIPINLGQLYLMRAQQAYQHKNYIRIRHYVGLAEDCFRKVLPSARSQKILNPPSWQGAYSLYIGMGWLYYWKFKLKYEEYKRLDPETRSSKHSQIIAYLKNAIKYMRGALAYRTGEKFPALNVFRLYTLLFSGPWFQKNDQGLKLYQDFITFRYEWEQYYQHRRVFEGTRKAMNLTKKDELYKYLTYAYYYYKFKKFGDAEQYFRYAIRQDSKLAPRILQLNRLEALWCHLHLIKEKGGRFSSINIWNRLKNLALSYNKLINNGMLQNDTESLFIAYNNQAICSSYRRVAVKLPFIQEVESGLNTALNLPLDKTYYVGAEEDPVTTVQIVNHNFYFLYKKIAKVYGIMKNLRQKQAYEERAKRYKNQLHPKD